MYLYTLTLVLVIKCSYITLHMVGFVLVEYAQGSLAYCIEINLYFIYSILSNQTL